MHFKTVLAVVVLALGLLYARSVIREPFDSALVLDDAERRNLARSGLIAARAAAFNAVPTLSTKVPANCFDTTDPAYDTAQCRLQRNTRDAQIATLVQQAYVNYCKAAPGCQQSKRTQVVLDDYTAKCKTQSASHLADIALLKSLLTTGGSPFVSLVGKRVQTPIASPLGSVSLASTTLAAAAVEASSNPLAAQANTIIVNLTTKLAQYCTDYKLQLDTDYTNDSMSLVLLKKTTSTQLIGPALAPHDAWLDTYYYFGASTDTLTDASRMQKCATALSQDEFVLGASQTLQSTQSASTVTAVAAAATPAAAQTTQTPQALIQSYTTLRQQPMQMSTATSWQKTLAQAYLSVQSAYNTASTQMATLMQNPQIQAYNQLASLIALSTSDMNTSKNTLTNFDNGTYAGAALCFPANKESTYQSTTGLNLQVGSQTLTSYCPEPTSVCARVAATPNALTSSYFRACKDLFNTQVQANTLNTQMQALLANATTQQSVTTMLALKSQIAQNLSDLNALQATINLNSKDIAAASLQSS
ncbi:hypothetical protein CVIRNUC_003362 [Coccomyxa viridis]|uniref:Secreted protein n=1 Tax=Coccomyxa viridis TaxID=1274662 RepID=A0AAV1I0A6_9CHLO|nr:hypothetical protein CVIRNUC_003362 [Coccomyxa viridis]